jgi:ferredoxin-NADP reductase/bacterioferritin-associated ferredoxin
VSTFAVSRSDAPAHAPRQGMACLCAGVTLAELDEAVAAEADATVQSLGAMLGCGVQCGSCVPVLREALGQDAWFAATAWSRAITKARDLRGAERLIYRVDIALRAPTDYPVAKPGQHVVLRADTDNGPVERTYTVVAQDAAAGRLTVAIRRKPDGRLTPWLLQSLEDAAPRHIRVSIPGGPGLHSAGTRSVVFFAGGVGVTPAVAMANALSANATMHLDYSVEHADDAAFLPKFDARCKDRPGFSYNVRQTSASGPLKRRDVQALEAKFRGSKFYICGPQGYVGFVHRELRKAKVDPARIHVELFALSPTKAPARSFRFKAYVAGAALALSPLLLLSPAAEAVRPHGHPNVGHEQLQCVACHVQSPASTRQTLQAKVKHAIGLRRTGAVFGAQPVTSATCIQCHANPDDRHAPNRFLEPRFEQARAETGAQACASCHREHSGTRLTVANTGYCVSCHQDLKVKNDRASPTHEHLVGTGQWSTCLQCHDYHGNHRWDAPLRLQDGATLDALNRYFRNGASPYGATVIKARQEKPS